ncbi:alpha-2-macroglobulin [Plastoroseomonas arctica]|uniref:Alpha-2-macroglobulin n=1 Tax=Plastoroseomonas arctica TaxID=1509237 RepID=A0AAF1K3V1_9PROT|nr:alpha-2-macroglobulin family protein [Plastoroseomonas arctica]MBR0655761.1 alpha-2-macroglobulin [Plastoroseomonas arctica]
MIRLILCLVLLTIAPAHAQPLDRVARADGATVVPDQFLRRWDAVTVLFDTDQGPAQGGPEDAPERLVRMAPNIPGAWQWLGPRTLQFRPTEPWQPLQRIAINAGGRTTRLVPLLSAPLRTSPEAGGDGLPNFDSIALTFPDPVDPAALSRLLSIELRDARGTTTRTLTEQDFVIRPIERQARAAPASYLVVLHRPIPDGHVVLLRLRLSDEPGLDDPAFELRLRSASPFTLTDTTCGRGFSRETQDGLLRCTPAGTSRRGLTLRFSEEPAALDAVQLRQALRITPPVDDLAVVANGRSWALTGRFRADTIHELRIEPGSLRDNRGRTLATAAGMRFTFEPERPSLAWDAGQGLVERLGPQMMPLRGQGNARADLRIHAIPPLGRDFWPFPANGLDTDDSVAPPLSGNEPTPWAGTTALGRNALAARIRALGSPAVSEMVSLPIQRGGATARFGIDAAPLFARIAGPQQPGAYLVGVRPVDGGMRRWMRVQVTDLVLTTVEEADRVRFHVTSLSTARPVEGAEILLDGQRGEAYMPLARGVTGADGSFTWSAPAAGTRPETLRRELRRIVILKGNDTLVLDPARPPPQYAEGNWAAGEGRWLGWTQGDVAERRPAPQLLCHVFTERPIYRPEDSVHIQAFLRRYSGGALEFWRAPGTLVISGPADQEWRIPVTPDDAGGVHHLFAEQTDATGDYTVRFENAEGATCGETTFKKEAYRLPSFEALLTAPTPVPLDGPFSVELLARYFAGGLAADRPVTWRVTQFPHAWAPPARDGFLFSSDSRFSAQREFRSSPVLNRETRTDDAGAAHLVLDPSVEPTAQPRRYVIEATVTGDDDIQVRSTQSVVALPALVLGLKVPRHIATLGAIDAEMIVTDAEGRARPDVAVTARLIRRNWISTLQASDFSQGAARYETETVDEVAEERSLTSAAEPTPLRFEAREAGVYLVQLDAEDRLGRRQTVRVDLFMAGDTPVTWPRPPAQTVTVSVERDAHAPGETATVLIQSPFQNARALVITEEPEGRFRYDWVDIANGFGRYSLTVRREQMPRVAVHVLLMRGRLAGPPPSATAPFDQGRPVTLAATAWINVTPVQHRVQVALQAPPSARPGEEIEVTLRLSDEAGRPIAGEAAFWLVDQAVLSLAREQPLDPLRNFIVDRSSRMAARDTRSMAFGIIPLDENPGGDGGEEAWAQENVSVRRNFTPVPVYLPRVRVGADGVARIRVRLPDTLTVFRLRAKAISGPSRFGFGVGEIRVRQPLVAQPALPRFLRPGDRFEATVIARIIEGPGGAGQATLSAEGLTLAGPATQPIAWQPNRPARLGFQVTVPPAGADAARLRFLVRRTADGAGDAVELTLPIQPDRPPLRERVFLTIAPGGSEAWPPPAQPIRPGSHAGRLSVTTDAAVVRLLGGMSALLANPYGGTEQRLALAAASVALAPFSPLQNAAGLEGRLAADVRAAQRAIQQATDADGLVAFWPRQRGSVWLTASAYRFLTAAARAGQAVDQPMVDRLAEVLTRALRSDYPQLMRGEELRERVAALSALAEAGKLEPAYAAELARRAGQMPTETLAQAAAAIAMLPPDSQAMLPALLEALWGRVQILNRDGRPAYAGLSETGGNPLILPSETRGLAEVTLAVSRAAPQEPRLALLRDGLLRLGGPNGWGDANADAAALRALAAGWGADAGTTAVRVVLPQGPQSAALGPATPVMSWTVNSAGASRVENQGGVPVLVLAERRYLPVQPGAEAPAVQDGFVLTRTLFRVPPGAGPLERLAPGPDGAIRLVIGDIVEEVAEWVNPEDRVHVALTMPMAAGMEPLNPALATAPVEATPSTGARTQPDWVAYGDDRLSAVFTTLPRGNHRIALRMRATIAGSFTQPPGEVEMLYRAGVHGASAGLRLVIAP